MLIQTRFPHDTFNHDQENDTHLVISLTAPKLDWETKRPRICVIPVIDVSGSMQGDKIEYAKLSVLKLIDHLGPGDFCGLVAFDSTVFPIQAPVELTQTSKDKLKAEVGKLQAGTSTNFAGGMLQGLQWLNKLDLPTDMILRVIMFTDGQANVGPQKREQLLPLVEAHKGRATISAFGYGHDADQDLLADIAAKGNGNYAFIKNPDDALSAFGKELGGLLSTYAQNIVIDVAVHNGHLITDVVSDVETEEREAGKRVFLKVPEVLSEERRDLVLALKLSKQAQALPRDMTAVDVKVSYDAFIDGRKEERTEEVKAKVRFVKPGEEQKEAHKDIAQIVGLARLVQTQLQAEKMADAGNLKGAQIALAAIGDAFENEGLEQLRGTSNNIGAKFLSADAYRGAKKGGYLRSSAKLATRAVGISGMDDEAHEELRCYVGSSSNAAQDAYVQSFTGGSPAPQVSHAVPGPSASWIGGAVAGGNLPPIVQQAQDALKDDKKNPPKPDKKGLSKPRSKRW